MPLQEVIVIWLDGTFKGGNYRSMRNEFDENITGSAPSSPCSDEIDDLICNQTKQDLIINGVLVFTVKTVEEAIETIEIYSQARVLFISSGSLGKDIVPKIVGRYPLIHSFYIFCFKMFLHTDWASEYIDCLQMFDHPIDLLVRLMRDISLYFIEQGKIQLEFDEPGNALTYFKYAWNLETRANTRDKLPPNTKNQEGFIMQSDYRASLNLLEGDDGLIRQAEKRL
ncbi:unnamed protein product [Rotaria socialis]|uniref:Uncharacterized protein n=1 Tax=Rotaria socialis TaxID=392032 RepID=A0A818FR34_9BILA|nr:unnamed protein product [Rotaria socialis]CAF3350201.1 unnamed protein product [Rotaria socialis]CAF3479839.1 unnamed protein product [Rotaria socialis]CAF4160354.1 unnamed protein product [Rotaria socialis]CAF4200095.1 unnamed protein product [Rotaria socialis]